jgi:SMP-30/Gluconolactonase/LRE-like region
VGVLRHQLSTHGEVENRLAELLDLIVAGGDGRERSEREAGVSGECDRIVIRRAQACEACHGQPVARRLPLRPRRLQPVAQGHQFIDLVDDSVLLGERWKRKRIVPPSAGYVVDDMVFDNEGGFYFTDFRGTSTEAKGGVFYVTPDFQSSITPVMQNMCAANGVALSPDGAVLWATEYCLNRLHRIELTAPGQIARFGASVPYHFIGRAPDSMRTDSAGNAYVAMNYQGRILVFSPYGVPIGQILLPGREENLFLKSTSLALVPGSRDLLIVARDVVGGRGSMIFVARGPAPGFPLFSHQ